MSHSTAITTAKSTKVHSTDKTTNSSIEITSTTKTPSKHQQKGKPETSGRETPNTTQKVKTVENKKETTTVNISTPTKGYKLDNNTDDDNLTTIHPILYSLITTEMTILPEDHLFSPINDTSPNIDQELIRPLIMMSVEDHLLPIDSILDPLLYNNDVNNLSAPALTHYDTAIENITIYCASNSDCTRHEVCVQRRCLRLCDAFIKNDCFKGISHSDQKILISICI